MVPPLVLLILLLDVCVLADADADDDILLTDEADAVLDTNMILIPLYYFIYRISSVTVFLLSIIL